MKKTFFLSLVMLFLSGLAFSQQVKYQLSSHILDITQGKPAQGVKIRLEKRVQNQWIFVDEKTTDENGRIKNFLKQDGVDHRGVYQLTYFVEPYFKRLKESTFYPFITVVFEIKDNNHYHVPITLSPYGYSTYRGN